MCIIQNQEKCSLHTGVVKDYSLQHILSRNPYKFLLPTGILWNGKKHEQICLIEGVSSQKFTMDISELHSLWGCDDELIVLNVAVF